MVDGLRFRGRGGEDADVGLYETSTDGPSRPGQVLHQYELADLSSQGEETSPVTRVRNVIVAAAQSKLGDSLCELPGYVGDSDRPGVLADAKTGGECLSSGGMTVGDHVVLAAHNASTSLTSLRGSDLEVTWDSSADCHAVSYSGHVIIGILIIVIASVATTGNLLVLWTFIR